MSGVNPKALIVKAHELEIDGFLLEASRIYDEAIELLRAMIDDTPDGDKKIQFLMHVEVLENDLLKVRQRVETSNRTSKSIRIPEGAIGFSYDKIFGSFLNESIREVHIYESCTLEEYQLENLVCFFDLLLKRCKNIRFICLFTKKIYPNPKTRKNQDFKLRMTVFNNWVKQFRDFKISFRYFLKNIIQDRRIELSNGTAFVLGYGLDLYQGREKFSLGTSDYELRKCKETYVEILQPIPNEHCLESENLI